MISKLETTPLLSNKKDMDEINERISKTAEDVAKIELCLTKAKERLKRLKELIKNIDIKDMYIEKSFKQAKIRVDNLEKRLKNTKKQIVMMLK
jgi:chromosome segregation ATPase